MFLFSFTGNCCFRTLYNRYFTTYIIIIIIIIIIYKWPINFHQEVSVRKTHFGVLAFPKWAKWAKYQAWSLLYINKFQTSKLRFIIYYLILLFCSNSFTTAKGDLVHSWTIYLSSISGVSQPLQRLRPTYLDSALNSGED